MFMGVQVKDAVFLLLHRRGAHLPLSFEPTGGL